MRIRNECKRETTIEIWLNHRGGRNYSDILVNDKGELYVVMNGVNGTSVDVYIPRHLYPQSWGQDVDKGVENFIAELSRKTH